MTARTAAAGAGGFLAELQGILPRDTVITDRDVLEGYRRDAAPFVDCGVPVAAVLPETAGEVSKVMQVATRHCVPVVPRGAGSGLSGGANAVDGGVVLSLARMNRILSIEPGDMLAVVEPGVVNADLSAAARGRGLWYPPDPASAGWSTLGGNLATNAGGLCCVKYGVTRDYVLGLEVVLADGTPLRTGRRTIKGVAGYDLTALFIGSEGTLGIITQATLRLRPAPPPASTVVALFDTLEAAGRAVAGITTSGLAPSLLELLDGVTLRAVDDWKHMDLDRDAAALLLIQSDAGGPQRESDVRALSDVCNVAGAAFVAGTSDVDEGAQLMQVRRLAYLALERQGTTLLDDVAVPPSRIPELLAAVQTIATRHCVKIGTFGHAGEGNMHPTVVFDADDADSCRRAIAAFDDILGAALALGGTITGEHGVGVLKSPYLAREVGAASMRVHAQLKGCLDPRNLLNPGKVLG